jgi:hypothetical protein
MKESYVAVRKQCEDCERKRSKCPSCKEHMICSEMKVLRFCGCERTSSCHGIYMNSLSPFYWIFILALSLHFSYIFLVCGLLVHDERTSSSHKSGHKKRLNGTPSFSFTELRMWIFEASLKLALSRFFS